MTYYIYQHSDPKILKLGIRMALYREKKPVASEWGWTEDNIDYKDSVEWWKNNERIAYLKEPEFKVGKSVWYMGKEYMITKIQDNGFMFLQFPGCESLKPMEECSHYYPGQQVESFKYVKEAMVANFTKGENTDSYSYDKEWQEVEEPDQFPKTKLKDGSEYEGKAFQSDDYTQFKEDVDKGIVLAEIN